MQIPIRNECPSDRRCLEYSRPDPEPAKEEEFNVVQSSLVLQAEEQAELDRMKLSTQSDPVTMLLNIFKQHPQFSFIAFTLVLASAVYFYSRHRGTEDDVS